MLTALFLAPALAADIHVDVATERWSQEIVHTAGEPFTSRFGPVTDGKKSIAFEVTWGPAPHSVMDKGYPLEVTLCRIWAKGKKKDRDCITEKVIARPEAESQEPVTGQVKMTDKWSFTMKVWATGDDIPTTELPMGERELPTETTPSGDVTTP
jgi:hypothetical protein